MTSIRSIVFSRILAVLAAFFLVAGAVLWFWSEKTLTRFFLEDHSRLVEFVVNNIQANYESDLRALVGLARMDGFSPFDLRKAQRLVEQFLQFENIYGSIHVYRADGKLLAARRRDTAPHYTPQENLHKAWDRNFVEVAEKVLRTGEPFPTETFQHAQTGLYQIYMAPILSPADRRGRKRVIGLVSGAIFYQSKTMRHLIEGLKFGKDNFIVLTDHGGHLLSHDGLDAQREAPLLAPDIQQASEYFHGKVRGRREAQSTAVRLGRPAPYFLFSGPIEEFRLTLSIGASQWELRDKQAQLLQRIFAGLIAGLLLCFFASIFIADRLAKPFGLIAGGIQRLNEGVFSRPIDYRRHDEIGRLARMINLLGRKIGKGKLLGDLWHVDTDPD